MKVTTNWLKQYVHFDWSTAELAERLTMLGLEVERIEEQRGEFAGVVVAQILSSEKHPNADKLSVCRVADGHGERQIVCGAKNYQVGDKVPLALPGCTLLAAPGAAPLTIKVSKMRGVESQGMMCSARELLISDDAEGLLILPPAAPVGQPFAEHLGRSAGDVVFDLEITPNRPDWNSVIGIARELSALNGNPLRLPEVRLPASPLPPAEQLAAVRLDAPDLCPRYTARVIRGVKIGPSPDWLRLTLEKVGIRSINNVVDVTNYVMMETGQPLHAFDYRLLDASSSGRPTVVVRRAAPGEHFTTLDGQTRPLGPDMLLIADEQKAVALAGVMGGQNSEISEQTVDVLLESAYFKPQNVRATAKKLDLRTDASYRFERGADIGVCDWASQRAAQLITETAGGKLAPGAVDAYPHPATAPLITLRHSRVNALVGIEIASGQQIQFLEQLGLETVPVPGAAGGQVTVRIPSYRVDLKREVDLIEEIVRLYGVDKIPSSKPQGARGEHPFDAVQDQIALARQILTGLGLFEAQGQTLVSDAAARLASNEALAELDNPLSSDMSVLRPSLIPGLLDSLRHNVSRKNLDVALFEIGRVFSRTDSGFREERRVALALTGHRFSPFWSGDERAAKLDIYDLKGTLESFLEHFGVRGVTFQKNAASTALFLESAVIQLGKQNLGQIGQLLPVLVKQYDLRDAVLLAELNLDLLLARRSSTRSFRSLPPFPAIRRDIAMLVAESVAHDSVIAAVKKIKPPHLETVELFDVFRGQNVPAGQKSVAYSFTYRHPERTLTDTEVNAIHENVVHQIRQSLQATVR